MKHLSRRLRWSLVFLAALAAGPAAAAADAFASAREAFRRAYAEAQAGTVPQAPDPAELQEYPLYPYLQRARIERALARADAWSTADEEARRFIEVHGTEPVGRGLRGVWLESLARRELWRPLVEHYRADLVGPELRCRYLRARIALAAGDARTLGSVQEEALDLWAAPRRLPPACEPLFQWLRDRGALTAERVELRVRLLLTNGQHEFARIIARRLPEARAAPLMQWAELIARPAAAIDAILAAPDRPVEREALLDGWKRLARTRPEEALARYERLIARRGLDAREASPFALALALGLAWDRRPEALTFFARVTPADLDDRALAWRARTALWAGDWRQAGEAIAAMSERQRSQARWRYWTARIAERRGDAALARSLYESLLPDDNFYSAKAAARLGRRAEPNPVALEHDRELARRIAERPHFVRARELMLCELRAEATAEWLAGHAALDPRERRQAIRLAARFGMHDVAVASAAADGIHFDYELLYPRPYDAEIAAAAAFADVETTLLYGLVRQESLFRPDAVSPAGAIGLTQLLPGTARLIARRLKVPAPSATELRNPGVNLRLGAAYLRSLIDRFDGQVLVALAGYNAGPRKAERWLPPEPVDADVWIENIPYDETREYVQRVLWHSVVFAWLQSGKAQDTSSWLVAVGPRRAEAPVAGTAGPGCLGACALEQEKALSLP